MAKIDLISNEWADIVFQGRNKVYGAYQLRKVLANVTSGLWCSLQPLQLLHI